VSVQSDRGVDSFAADDASVEKDGEMLGLDVVSDVGDGLTPVLLADTAVPPLHWVSLYEPFKIFDSLKSGPSSQRGGRGCVSTD